MLSAVTQTQLATIVKPILDLCSYIVPILLSVVGGIGAIWCIVLGVKYAKAEEPQDHDKAKNSLKNAIIGFVIIFVLLAMLEIGIKVLTTWYAEY